MSGHLEVILGFAGVCVTQGVIWADGRRKSRQTDMKLEAVGQNADTAATEAASAVEQTKGVGNGFTAKVLAYGPVLEELARNMSELRDEVKDDRARLNAHIGDHASADVRRKSP
jgi:hypothetical protein